MNERDLLAVRLPGGLDAPSRARKALLSLDGTFGRAHDDVMLLVTELVTNAVRHAGADEDRVIDLEVEVARRHVRVAVTDPGGGFVPVPAPRPRPEGGGAGLVLVDRLASRWAVEPGPPSRVWFELDREGDGAAAPAAA